MSSLQGQFLIAGPDLLDPNFHRTVVLIIEHNEQGALGLIVNRPTSVNIASVWEQASVLPCPISQPVYQGGPCEGPLMVLHDQPQASQIDIGHNICFTTHREDVESLVTTAHGTIKFFYGHSGWTAGQLEAELQQGSWLTTSVTSHAVFNTPNDLWERLTRRTEPRIITIDPALLPDDPSVN